MGKKTLSCRRQLWEKWKTKWDTCTVTRARNVDVQIREADPQQHPRASAPIPRGQHSRKSKELKFYLFSA